MKSTNMRKIDWSKYKFRCSQLYKINVGTIGIKENQEEQIKELIQERDEGINVNGNKCKWTAPKEEKLVALIKKRDAPWYDQLPATMKTELRAIHRAERYNRNFVFTNKYIQKGLAQEEEAITTLQKYRNEIIGERTFFVKNGERLTHHDYWTGEPDIRPMLFTVGQYKGMKVGFDTKCSWDLSSFPYPEDPLVQQYEDQNQGYIELEDVDGWITASVLVNGTEEQVHNEKLKWYYALKTKDGMPDEPDHKYHNEYIEKCKEVERMMIFDYDRFMALNPFHQMEHTREEWMNMENPRTGRKGLDIPLEERVVEKFTLRSEQWSNDTKERVELGRKYLNHLEDKF